MSRKTISPVGALHPVLFFAGVYVVVLLFSIFICSSIFYSCNAVQTDLSATEKQAPAAPAQPQGYQSNGGTVAALK